MLQDIEIDPSIRVDKWEGVDADEDDAKIWIYNSLMGETHKGDTIEFNMYSNEHGVLWAGLLTSASHETIIPAKFAAGTEDIINTYYYNGERITEPIADWMEELLGGKYISEQMNFDLDQMAESFLTGKGGYLNDVVYL